MIFRKAIQLKFMDSIIHVDDFEKNTFKVLHILVVFPRYARSDCLLFL